MKHIFLDTNIIIDVFAARVPFDTYAIEIFRLAKENKVKIYISAASITTIYYLLRVQKITHVKSMKIIDDLQKIATIITADSAIIYNSVKINFLDFEDGVQYISAISNPKISLIVTRDRKGFKKSSITVADANQAVLYINAL
jgi:predicted nucleic acid-binding protein